MRRIAVIDAPSNLGLRPPTATSVPGCAKAPGALRDHNLLTRLGARDAGCITPPRYDPAGWQPGDGVAQSAEIAVFVKRLADRIGSVLGSGDFPLVLGGDCSILLGAGLAMRRYQHEAGGRIGLVYVDGHSDFRHEGNASYVGAAAGEALALATGRGQANLASIEQRRPYFRDVDVALLGIRTHDEYRLDLQAAGIVARAVPELRSNGAARSAQWARDQLRDCAGFWVHIDVDVLDPAVMPAVDAPDVGGIAYRELEILLSGLVGDPRCLGAQVTVFDPDYDPDGQYAAEVTDVLVAGLEPLITSSALAAASPDPVISAPPFADPVSAPPISAPPLAPPRPPAALPPLMPTPEGHSVASRFAARTPIPDISDMSGMTVRFGAGDDERDVPGVEMSGDEAGVDGDPDGGLEAGEPAMADGLEVLSGGDSAQADPELPGSDPAGSAFAVPEPAVSGVAAADPAVPDSAASDLEGAEPAVSDLERADSVVSDLEGAEPAVSDLEGAESAVSELGAADLAAEDDWFASQDDGGDGWDEWPAAEERGALRRVPLEDGEALVAEARGLLRRGPDPSPGSPAPLGASGGPAVDAGGAPAAEAGSEPGSPDAEPDDVPAAEPENELEDMGAAEPEDELEDVGAAEREDGLEDLGADEPGDGAAAGDSSGPGAAVATEQEEPPARPKPAWLLGRYSRSASLSLDSLPRDSAGPGGLRRAGGPFVPAQAARRVADDSPESPLSDVVPAARTPVEEEETTS